MDHYLLGCLMQDHIADAQIDWSIYDAVLLTPVLSHLLQVASSEYNELIFWRLDAAEVAQLLSNCIGYMDAKLEQLAQVARGPVIVTGFWEPTMVHAGPMFRFDPELDFKEFVHELNRGLRASTRRLDNFWFLDPNLQLEALGRGMLQDDVLAASTHAAFLIDGSDLFDRDRLVPVRPFGDTFGPATQLPVFTRAVLEEVETLLTILEGGEGMKLIVVDLDDTLWRGVAAEDDYAGAARREGWPMGLAEALLVFKKRGGLLAICSKNDHEETVVRFAQIWQRTLRIEDFAATAIGWDPKPDGMAKILQALNILPEHTLFIDDNPREVDEMRARYPAMRFAPENHLLWRSRILRGADMLVARITPESADRTALAQAKVARDASALTAVNRDVWLAEQGFEQVNAMIDSPADRAFERALELINKTNQFNTNGRRWTAAELGGWLNHGGRMIVSRLADRSVDNGLIGVALIRGVAIEQVVLSCRVFNLGVEVGLIHDAMRLILQNHPRARGSIVPTGRNLVCQNLYRTLGFKVEGEGFASDNPPEGPPWIRFISAVSPPNDLIGTDRR